MDKKQKNVKIEKTMSQKESVAVPPLKLPIHSVSIFRLESTPDNTPLRRTYFHKNDYPINMHSHNFYELNIIVEGKGVHYLENKAFPIKAGDVFAISPSTLHGYWAETNDLNIFHLLLPHYVLEKYADELAKFPGYPLLFEIEPLMRRNISDSFFLHLSQAELKRLNSQLENLIFIAEEEENEETNLLFELQSILLICTLSTLINKATLQQPAYIETTQPDSVAIAKTIDFMHKNFAERLSVEELAKKANMSRSTFLRRFTAMCQQSPMEYLSELRIKKACQLLKNGNYSVTDIAQRCGFFDCSHFIRVFTKLRGTTPNAYRKRILSRY